MSDEDLNYYLNLAEWIGFRTGQCPQPATPGVVLGEE